MSRRRNLRKQKPARRIIWLIVEGETELHYLTGLRNDPYRPKPTPPVRINLKCASGRGPDKVVAKAEDVRRAQGRDARKQEFYCVFDVEDPTPGKREALKRSIRGAARMRFGLVLSNPCFEVWLHCHLDSFAPQAFVSCDACVESLKRGWTDQRISPQAYQKADPRIYDKLADRLVNATEAARYLREVHHGSTLRTANANASTDVYRLVEYLQGLRSNCRPYPD